MVFRTYIRVEFEYMQITYSHEKANEPQRTFSDIRGKKFSDTKNRTTFSHLKHEHRSIFFRIAGKSAFSQSNLSSVFGAVLYRILCTFTRSTAIQLHFIFKTEKSFSFLMKKIIAIQLWRSIQFTSTAQMKMVKSRDIFETPIRTRTV